jgi:hypothetical protein
VVFQQCDEHSDAAFDGRCLDVLQTAQWAGEEHERQERKTPSETLAEMLARRHRQAGF